MKLFGIEIRHRIVAFHWGYRSYSIGVFKGLRISLLRYRPYHYRKIQRYFAGFMISGVLGDGMYSSVSKSNFEDIPPLPFTYPSNKES